MKTIEDAARALADVFGDGWTAGDVGSKFTCTEADIIARVLVAGGQRSAAEVWLGAHSEGDDGGDAHGELYNEATGSVNPVQVDNYIFQNLKG